MNTAADRHSVPGAYGLVLLDLVKRWQITDREMLDGFELTREQLAAPATRVVPRRFRQLIERGFELTGEPGLAVYMGLQMRVSSHGFLGFALMTAATVRDAISLAERFAATRLAALGFSFHIEGETASVVLEDSVAIDSMREFLVVSMLVGVAHVGQEIAGQPIRLAADMTFDEPEYCARLSHILPFTARFGRPTNRLVVAASDLDLPLVMADTAAAKLAREQCERLLDAAGDGDRTLARVRELLPAEQAGFRAIEDVARRMHISTRTLKRRLAAAGTRYSDVLDDLRRERALLLIENRQLTLEDIAERLGYSDVANFTRAFRRWTGSTPAALRRR